MPYTTENDTTEDDLNVKKLTEKPTWIKAAFFAYQDADFVRNFLGGLMERINKINNELLATARIKYKEKANRQWLEGGWKRGRSRRTTIGVKVADDFTKKRSSVPRA